MENTDTIIDISNVTMRFNLAEQKTDTIKEYLVKLATGKLHLNEFFALRDVSFQIKRGEAVALIGKNGSGKSTLLKIVAGVLYPTMGSVTVNGSIAPLIELGAGFDPELTARENIYMNGAILGHNRACMDRHFEQIVEFSELRDFIDVPLKNYSRGISMLPLLRQGRDSVALRRVDSPIRRNDILFYRRPDGSFVLHRVKAVTEAALSL